MSLMFLYLSLAIGISFLCSILEAVLLSAAPAHIMVLENKHPGAARILRAFKADIDEPLSAILSLNTIAHTLGAAEVGAQAQLVFGKASVAVISALLTFAILVFSEIIPKTIGATYWRLLLVPAAYTIKVMVYSMYPLTVLSRFITRLISRGKRSAVFTREELKAQVDLGIQEGILEAQESRILKNIIRFRSLRAKDIMTPRTVLISRAESDTAESVINRDIKLPVSRILVHREQAPEEITGYVLKSELMDCIARGEGHCQVGTFRRDIVTVPDSFTLDGLLKRFLKEHEHIAVLLDEYGGLAGIVTMEDIIETILGTEIVDELDTVRDMQAYARSRWQQRADKLGLVDREKISGGNHGSD